MQMEVNSTFLGPTATYRFIQMSENDQWKICLILQDKAVSYESSDPCRGLVCSQPAGTELRHVWGEMHWKDDSTVSSVVLGRLRAHCWEIGLYLSVSQSTDPSQDWTEEICHRAQT